jgi:hypothetical protein
MIGFDLAILGRVQPHVNIKEFLLRLQTGQRNIKYNLKFSGYIPAEINVYPSIHVLFV